MELIRMRTFEVPCPFFLYLSLQVRLFCNVIGQIQRPPRIVFLPQTTHASIRIFATVVRAGSPDIRILSFGCLF